MGTTFTVKMVTDLPDAQIDLLAERVGQELEAVNSHMSTYLEDSELSRFNRFLETTSFPLSPGTLEVLRLAQEISHRSGGAFDVTVAPLVNAWGFGPGKTGPGKTAPGKTGPKGIPPRPPEEELLGALRQQVGYENLEIDSASARKRIPSLTCDLSAIAKGFAVDQVALALEEAGVDRYMVEVGGEVRTSGASPRGVVWRIGIEGPVEGRHRVQKLLPLDTAALATSGDYRQFYEVDGKRYSHTIDPRTGRPVEHAGASVSVVMDSCAGADAWATALLVLGPDEGIALARQENLAALFVVYEEGGGSERMTPAFEKLLEKNAIH